jgi:conjugal transfer ATP-binding protein TraC
MIGNLSERIQIWGFEDDIVIFQDGSTGFGLNLSSLDVMTWGIDRVNGLANGIDQFLNGLPPFIDLQFIQSIEPGNLQILNDHDALGKGCLNVDVKNLTQFRIDKLKAKDAAGELPRHELSLFVRRPLKRLLGKNSNLFSSKDKFVEIAEVEFGSEMSETLRLRDNIVKSLQQVGITSTAISQKKILEQVYSQWNPNRSNQIDLGYYDPEYVVPGLIYSDVLNSEKGFSIGTHHYRLVSLKSFPDVTTASMAQIMRELAFGSKLFVSIHVLDQQKVYESLQTDRRMAFSLARGRRSGVSDLESEAKLQEIESLLASLISQGEKVFEFSFQVLLCSESEEELEIQVGETLSKIRQLAGAEAMQETLASFDIFCDLAIPNCRGRERSKRIKTSNLSDFLPIYGPWEGHSRASVVLRSRLGSLVKFDPFSSNLPNHNILISGSSGSGKSVLANLLLLELLKENPKIYIVDVGNSYGRMCELMGGESVRLGIDMTLSLNPFDLPEGETVPSGEKIKFLVSLVEMMTKESGTSGLNKLEKALLEESVLKCYENSVVPQLSDLRILLLEHSEVSLRQIGRILGAWTGNSAFGKFIDRPTNIQLKKNLISFDLKGLDTVPDLQAVCLFLITDLVWREVQKDRGVKKILLFDECWQLLESEAGSHFIGNVFRTFRKYYAGVIAISQDIDDFARSKVATAILPNSGTKWIMMQKGSDPKRLAEVLQLNEVESTLVASLFQERGKYSEAFLITGDNRSVVAIEPTSMEYWIATTDPRDIEKFEAMRRENPDMSVSQIVTLLSESNPFGVAYQN